MKCDYPECAKTFESGEMFYCSKYSYRARICQKCSEREHMPNIKITAEVDGKQVPLENISTETFEAIKALEKPKEIPVARIGHYKDNPDDRRLFLKITNSIRHNVACSYIDAIAINLQTGCVNNSWSKDSKGLGDLDGFYENVRPL